MQNIPDFERLCRSLLRELQRNEFVANQCRIAQLRELTFLYAVTRQSASRVSVIKRRVERRGSQPPCNKKSVCV